MSPYHYNSVKFTCLLMAISFAFQVMPVSAHNKVVVIPMFSDSTELPKNVVTVGKQGADFSDPITAIESILDASAEKRYRVSINPGDYELSNPLRMKEYVDVVGGVGHVTVKLIGEFGGSEVANSAAVIGASNATLYNIAIENRGLPGLPFSTGIYNDKNLSDYSNLRVTVSGGSTTTYGIYNTSGSPHFSNMSIVVTGQQNGVGMMNNYAAVLLDRVSVIVYDAALSNIGFNNVGFMSLPNIGMLRTDAFVSGGLTAIGIENTQAGTSVMGGVVDVQGATTNYGVVNHSGSIFTGSHHLINGVTSSFHAETGSRAYFIGSELTTGVTGDGDYRCFESLMVITPLKEDCTVDSAN